LVLYTKRQLHALRNRKKNVSSDYNQAKISIEKKPMWAQYDAAVGAKLTLLLVLIGFFALPIFLRNFGAALRSLVTWSVIFVILGLVYLIREDLVDIKEEFIAELTPSSPKKIEGKRTRYYVSKDRSGHFFMRFKINDKPIRALVDTGASHVFIGKSDAKKLGLDLSESNPMQMFMTANGQVWAALTYADSLTIGEITIKNVPVYISTDYDGTALLGMSIISQFATITIRDDKLYLEPVNP
jgi:aspartyl protease family protein